MFETVSFFLQGSEKSESVRRIPGKPARLFTSSPVTKPLIGTRRSASPQLSTISVPSPVRYQRAHVAEPAKRILSLPTTMTKSRSTPLQSPYHHEASSLSSSSSARLPVARLSSSHVIMETGAKELSTPLVAAISSSAESSTATTCHERYTYVDVISGSGKSEERASGSTVYGDPPSGGPHDYHYPALDSKSRTSEKRDSISSIKVHKKVIIGFRNENQSISGSNYLSHLSVISCYFFSFSFSFSFLFLIFFQFIFFQHQLNLYCVPRINVNDVYFFYSLLFNVIYSISQCVV